jgi:hypothetical protein
VLIGEFSVETTSLFKGGSLGGSLVDIGSIGDSWVDDGLMGISTQFLADVKSMSGSGFKDLCVTGSGFKDCCATGSLFDGGSEWGARLVERLLGSLWGHLFAKCPT